MSDEAVASRGRYRASPSGSADRSESTRQLIQEV